MDLKELQKNWNELGEKDPLWAILTDPKQRGNKWNPEAFFKTGEGEILSVLNHTQSLGLSFSKNKALDFGCGVGRLTQALCQHFNHCYGVDIAPSMINLAKKYNRYGERCKYYLNETSDLTSFEDNSFDFIYSSIVLQHMNPEYSKHYINEFLRVLAPGGVLVFQIPSEFIPPEIGESGTQSRNKYGLPVSAFKSQITVSEPFMIAEPGVQTRILTKVKNISDITWPGLGAPDGQYQIRLGNHWLDDSGNLLAQDDGRASLTNDLHPMVETTLSLMITSPMEPGNYVLELDMVQEAVAWFGDKGSETTRIPFRVLDGQMKDHGLKERGSPNSLYRIPKLRLSSIVLGYLHKIFSQSHKNSPAVLTEPKIEMYSIPKDTVLNLIREGRGIIVDLQEDNKAGKDWVSFTYYVTKETAPNKQNMGRCHNPLA